MNDMTPRHPARYHLVTALILVIGLASAAVIYATAAAPVESPMIDTFEESKRYVRDLELYGGKANVMAYKFSRWFAGLWHGQTLAFTVTFLTIVSAGVYFLLARLSSAGSVPDVDHDDNGSDIG